MSKINIVKFSKKPGIIVHDMSANPVWIDICDIESYSPQKGGCLIYLSDGEVIRSANRYDRTAYLKDEIGQQTPIESIVSMLTNPKRMA